MAVIEEQQDPLAIFLYALKAPETKRKYPSRFKVFLDFLKLEGTFEEQDETILGESKKKSINGLKDNKLKFTLILWYIICNCGLLTTNVLNCIMTRI